MRSPPVPCFCELGFYHCVRRGCPIDDPVSQRLDQALELSCRSKTPGVQS